MSNGRQVLTKYDQSHHISTYEVFLRTIISSIESYEICMVHQLSAIYISDVNFGPLCIC